MMRSTRRLSVWLLVTALCAALACKEPEPKMSPEDAGKLAAMWSEQVGGTLKEQAAASAAGEALEALFKSREAKAAEEAARKAEPPFDLLAQEVYAAHKFKPGFIRKGQLTATGQLLLKTLEGVADDALDPAPYRVAQIKERLGQLDALVAEYNALGDFKPGESEVAFIKAWVAEQPQGAVAVSEETLPKLTEQVMGSDAGKSLRATITRYEDLSGKMAQLQAEIEHGLALGFLRYAHTMRDSYLPDVFVHERHDDLYNDPELKLKRNTDASRAQLRAGQLWRQATFVAQAMADKRGVEILRARMKGRLERLLTAKDEAVAKAELELLIPAPQYALLRAEYVRYRDIVEAGGWEEIEPRALSQGQRSPAVHALKKRLAIEGYMPQGAAIDDLFDANLTEAIKVYQEKHQMTVTGKLDKSFWRSLNVSADKRRDQIEVNMRRWRKTNILHQDQDTYVYINIPDFTAEIWKNKARAMRMRVVVGNNDTVEDEETGAKSNPNRTPTLSAYIDRVIYNPYWNLTQRIRLGETLIEVRKDTESRYRAKMEKLLGGGDPKPASPATPAALPAAPPAQGSAAVAALITKTKEGPLSFDIEGFKRLYTAKYGSEPNMAALFPYLSLETGQVDVSVTKPDVIPEWYAANGYEVMYPSRDFEYIRQLPGDNNLLGRVKVIFPNLYDVYLHDTPFKGHFTLPIRAASHGCMRMHKPLDFAKWILENDGSYDAKEIKEKLKEKVYHPVFLKRRIPIHIEYHTVRVDDDGRAAFLIDIYGRDSAADPLAGPPLRPDLTVMKPASAP
jgi:murein L,D-transpeptidase YcbB/YkuD